MSEFRDSPVKGLETKSAQREDLRDSGMLLLGVTLLAAPWWIPAIFNTSGREPGDQPAGVPQSISRAYSGFPEIIEPAHLEHTGAALRVPSEKTETVHYWKCGDEVTHKTVRATRVKGTGEVFAGPERFQSFAIMTAGETAVKAAMNEGYTGLAVTFTPKNKTGEFAAQDTQCGVIGEGVVVKDGKVWWSMGIGEKDVAMGLVAYNNAGATKAISTHFEQRAQKEAIVAPVEKGTIKAVVDLPAY